MNNKAYLISFIFIFMFLINSCGFKPIYSEKYYKDNNNYFAVLKTNNSREINNIFDQIFRTNNFDKSIYKIEVNISERLIPLITNDDGTVSKYKVEIYTEFDLITVNDKKSIHSSFARGFNSYNVISSEYQTEENKKIAIKQATQESLRIAKTKIQNQITKFMK